MEKRGGIWYNQSMKVESLKKAMQGVKDPRRTECGNIRHKLADILIIGLCTVVCNGEDFEDMEEFGKEREEFLRGFLELPNGIPDSDTFRRVSAGSVGSVIRLAGNSEAGRFRHRHRRENGARKRKPMACGERVCGGKPAYVRGTCCG